MARFRLRTAFSRCCSGARTIGLSGGVLGLLSANLTAQAQPAARPENRLGAPETPDSASLAATRRRIGWTAVGIGTGAGAIIGTLATTWYTGPTEPFRWFDDSREWAQLDKFGHVWGAFQQSRAAVDALRKAGLAKPKALLWGAPVGLVLQGTIEYFDGRSPGYGASASDLAANAVGTALFAGQTALWDEPRLWPKMGAHLTPFAAQRPNTLGSNLPERLLKDYNGQTYWLTADVGAFLPPDTRWPRWLHLAAGYGAEQLVYGEPTQNRAAGYRTVRQFYFGPDLHLLGLRPKRKALRYLYYVLSIVRLPAPTLELRSTGGVRFHGLYF